MNLRKLPNEQAYHRNPKYAMRKLSIGFVSCMLGFMLTMGSLPTLNVYATDKVESGTKVEAEEQPGTAPAENSVGGELAIAKMPV